MSRKLIRGNIKQRIRASLATIIDTKGHFRGYSKFPGEPRTVASRKFVIKARKLVREGKMPPASGAVIFSDVPDDFFAIGNMLEGT
jgi:hypothetical protein